MKKNMTMLILSCDNFSDLWEGHINLLNQNWPDRDIETMIVTDAATNKSFPGIKIIVAGKECAWSERLAYAIRQVETEYIFVTLDDYFLIKKVPEVKIRELLEIMDRESLDYVRLFPRPKSATMGRVANYRKIHWIDTGINYSVNLYSGIWRKDFIASTVRAPKNAWQFEVLLHKRAQEYHAKCVVSLRNEFQILDVVRKGKLLHNAVRYFKKHPHLYSGDREVNTWKYEIDLGIQTLAARYLPAPLKKKAKKIMTRRGKVFFSDEVE